MWVFSEANDSNPNPTAYFTPNPPYLNASHILIIWARREEGTTEPPQEGSNGMQGCARSKRRPLVLQC